MSHRQVEEAAAFPPPELVALVHARRGRLSARQRAAGAEALVDRMRAARTERRRPVWALSAAAALVFVVALGASLRMWDRHLARTLSYSVEGGRVGSGGVIESEPLRTARLFFSDGTEVLLNPGAIASLRTVDTQGAHMTLRDGSLYVDVVHRASARWSFDAGPFVISVTGTAFRLSWDANHEELDVRMDRGSIEVNSPLSYDAFPVRSGQHLVVRVRQRETFIRDTADEASDTASGGAIDAGGLAQEESKVADTLRADSGTRGGTRARPECGGPEQDWPRLLAKGEFENIIRQAEHFGTEECLASARSADLSALADAARYGRHDDLARRALLAQRSRFAGARASHDAAFLLGKLEEAALHPTAAVDWYGRYMEEDARGPYGPEALGRKMVVVQQIYGDPQARQVAADYLNHFPDGPYSARARVLTRTP